MTTGVQKKHDERIDLVLNQILKLKKSKYDDRLPLSGKDDAIDIICKSLNSLAEELAAKEDKIEHDKKRVEGLTDLLLEYAVMDFSRKSALTSNADEIDAMSAGLNTLGEELDASLTVQKKYAAALEKANRLLSESNKKIQAIFDNAPDAIIVADLNYKITEWNKSAEQMYGYTRNEVIGKSATDIIQSEHIHPYTLEAAANEMKSRGAWNGEIIQQTDRKEKMVILSSSAFLKNDAGIPVGYLGVNRDITQLKKMQDALQISEEKFNKAFTLSPAGLSITHIDTGKYIEVNDSFLQIIGFTREEIIGHTSLETKIFDKEERSEIIKEVEEKGSVKNREIVFKRKSGEVGSMLFSTELIEINNVKCTLSIFYDISKRKKTEVELSQKSEELARSNAELEQFAYVASHDLQEPLRMITSYVQLLEKRYKDKLDQDAFDFINYAVDGANRMQTLIYSLLEYSRVNRVKPYEYMDLNDTLTEVLKDLSIAINESNAKVSFKDLPVIFGDKVLIGQLFFNLIGNALKFKGKTPVEISIIGKLVGNEFLFAIKDNGIGIQKEYKEKIFVIFQRLHTKDKYPGTGIGLAICKKIVERHEGRIWVESEIDKGATFYFTIKSELKSPTMHK